MDDQSQLAAACCVEPSTAHTAARLPAHLSARPPHRTPTHPPRPVPCVPGAPGCPPRKSPSECKSGRPPARHGTGSAEAKGGRQECTGTMLLSNAGLTEAAPAQSCTVLQCSTRTTMLGWEGSSATARISRRQRSRCSLERKRRRERLTAKASPLTRWRTRNTCTAGRARAEEASSTG